MYYYVYLIKFSSNQFYIGSRTSKVTPEDDKKYWGSPVTYKHLWKDTNLEKTKHILKVCSNFDEMMELEVKLIKEAWNKFPNECLNRHAMPVFHPEISRKNLEKGRKTIQEKYSKEYTLKSPDGQIITGKNISELCRKYDLNKPCIVEVISGKRVSHKGWTLPETTIVWRELVGNMNSKDFVIKSPSGEIFKGRNIKKFCIENNLHHQSICRVISGERKFHKGWTLP